MTSALVLEHFVIDGVLGSLIEGRTAIERGLLTRYG